MTRTDLCPILTHFENYGLNGQYVGVYCNHGYPCSAYSFTTMEYVEYDPDAILPPEVDRCAFWNKCKRENGWNE
jgi:hypothetical protein